MGTISLHSAGPLTKRQRTICLLLLRTRVIDFTPLPCMVQTHPHTYLSDPFPLLSCLKESLDHFHYFHIDRLGVTDLPRTFAQVCGGRRPIIRPDFPRQDLHFRTFALNQISPPLFFFSCLFVVCSHPLLFFDTLPH